MTPDQIRDVLDGHAKWLRGEGGGERAYLAGVNLTCAYLAGADLARANLARANLTDAYLAGADLAGARLPGANLSGANLSGANLEGACLDGANLVRVNLAGAKIDAGEIERYLSGGWLLSYGWTALMMRDGTTRLRYGCEEHALAKWPALMRGLCERHVGDKADAYERDLTALLAFVGSLAANK